MKLLAIILSLFPQIINVQDRTQTSLDGSWDTMVDLYETGYYDYRRNPMDERSSYFADRHYFQDKTRLIEYDFDQSDKLQVPGDWNTQNPKFYLYEGTIWYRRTFDAAPEPGKRYFVYFGAANYESVVGLNGHVLGTHIGGYTPFNFEVTDNLKDGKNSLIVKVDNKRYLDAVPTVNFDWWNYGGITRSVRLIEVPETFIRDYCVRLAKDGKGIEGWIRLDGSKPGQDISINIEELKMSVKVHADENGYAEFSAAFPKKMKPVLWCPENPKLYDVTIASETDRTCDRIGFRTITTEGSRILLNGEPIFLKGVAIHEEIPTAPSGRAFSEEHARTTLGWAKEMGCNYVRLAHYPHNETMVRIAEEMGIMVWDEIPVYWTIDWTNEATYQNAENQLQEMITRDINRANVIIWSVSNETPRGPQRLAFLSRLIDKAREMDPTRLVSSAIETNEQANAKIHVDDELIAKTDLISFNQYVGWYNGDNEKCDRVEWIFHVNKPVVISEFGGGAKYGNHGKVNERFTEEYMMDLYEHQIAMLGKIPQLAGTSPWILKDFRSPKRFLKGIQDDFNRKGLISEKGEKKGAFYIMKSWYESMGRDGSGK